MRRSSELQPDPPVCCSTPPQLLEAFTCQNNALDIYQDYFEEEEKEEEEEGAPAAPSAKTIAVFRWVGVRRRCWPPAAD